MAKIKNGWIVFGIIALVVVGLFGLGMFDNLSFSVPDLGGEDTGEYDYTGRNVDLTIMSSNKYTGADADATLYVYEEQPENWGNGRVDVQDGHISTYTVASGSVVMTELPGTYYVRAVLSTYYDEFFEVTIPVGGEVPLNDYNDADGSVEKIKMLDVETLSLSNVDLGVATNETSDITYTKYQNVVVDDDEAFLLDEIKFQEDATYSFATDSDGDGVYDEGVNKIKVTLDGRTFVPFDVSASINEFSGDDEATWDYNKLYEENDAINMKFEVTADATLDAVGDADEKLGDGEDILDSVILVDGAGNTATFDVTG